MEAKTSDLRVKNIKPTTASLGEQQGGLQCNRKKYDIVDAFNQHTKVWDDGEYRQITIDILLTMGTNYILAGNRFLHVWKEEGTGSYHVLSE